MKQIFHDREQAAMLLADKLKSFGIKDSIVLAIPRGGVPLGSVLARELHIPLDLLMSKKIGHPTNPEFAIGSVTLHDLVLSDAAEDVPETYIASEVKRLKQSLQTKYDYFTGGRKPYALKGKDVIIVDDGLATGNTMLACIADIRRQQPQSIVVAVPVSSRSAASKVQKQVSRFISLEIPTDFFAVGEFYEDFSPVSDQEVVDHLKYTAELSG